MNYLRFALAWPRLVDAPLRVAKREALVDHVAPAFDALRERGHVHHWSHTFWGEDDLGTNVIRVIAATDTPAAAAEQVREEFEAFEEGHEFSVEAPYNPERARGFWGGETETWFRARAGLSTLAVAAIEERLGEPYAWHRKQNRPGHIWANQLALTYMDESAVYAGLARGYLEQVSTDDDEAAAALQRVRDHLDAAVELLPDP